MASNPEPRQPQPKPTILVLAPSTSYRIHELELSHHFHLLKPYQSHLPLPDFLATTTATAITAAMTTSTGPPITASSVLRHLPGLRCIVNCSAGTEHIDFSECRRRGVAVANAADVYSVDCADSAVGLVLDVLRKVSAGDRYVRAGEWAPRGEYCLGNRLGDKKVGIVGLGSIGSCVAKRLEAFGCMVSYTSRKQKQSVSYPFYPDVLELAANSDVLVLCCALNDQTRHMINKEVLSALGKDGIIINIARGAVVDEEELVRCLVEGRIAGAGLGVFEDEPKVPKGLFDLDNVVLSPHLAFLTEESMRGMYEHIKANFEAFFSGKPLLSPINVD